MSFEEIVEGGRTDDEQIPITIAHIEHFVLRWARNLLLHINTQTADTTNTAKSFWQLAKILNQSCLIPADIRSRNDFILTSMRQKTSHRRHYDAICMLRYNLSFRVFSVLWLCICSWWPKLSRLVICNIYQYVKLSLWKPVKGQIGHFSGVISQKGF